MKLCHLQQIRKRVRSYPKNQIRDKWRQSLWVYWRRGSTICKWIHLEAKIGEWKEAILLKLSSGTVTRTQSPNQCDFTDKLFRKWTKTGEKVRSEIENPERTIIESKRSKRTIKKNRNYLGETSKLSKILQKILFFLGASWIFLYYLQHSLLLPSSSNPWAGVSPGALWGSRQLLGTGGRWINARIVFGSK